ncbi:MAG: hypothetical protein NVS3B14_03860 [Ktedonobacteraceae bacterium]
MARSIETTASPAHARAGQVRLGVAIELLSLIWMLFEASIAITAGLIARSMVVPFVKTVIVQK